MVPMSGVAVRTGGRRRRRGRAWRRVTGDDPEQHVDEDVAGVVTRVRRFPLCDDELLPSSGGSLNWFS
jgi:hypothetical protein